MSELRSGRVFLLETTSGLAAATLCSHVGAVRTENQDRVGRVLGRAGEIIIVADGIGGQSGGAEAATLAVRAYEALVNPGAGEEEISPDIALQRATEQIHREIHDERNTQPAFNAMATTVAVVYLRDRVATVGHLGDTRVYLFRDGQLQRLTRDHSVVERMVQEGLLTETEARAHPKGHILTRSLGQMGTPLETQQLEVRTGDLLLLCSDGLWACVPDSLLAAELSRTSADTSTAVDSLLGITLQAGAPDNVSIALVRILAVPVSVGLPEKADMLVFQRAANAGIETRTAKRNLYFALCVLLILVALAVASTRLH